MSESTESRKWGVDRRGCTRIVFLTSRHVYKVPNFLAGWRLFLRGLLANMQEASLSATLDEFLGVPTCPVLRTAPGGWLVIMPRLRIMTRAEWDDFDDTEIRGTLPGWVDLKPENLGWSGDRWVLVDYGGEAGL